MNAKRVILLAHQHKRARKLYRAALYTYAQREQEVSDASRAHLFGAAITPYIDNLARANSTAQRAFALGQRILAEARQEMGTPPFNLLTYIDDIETPHYKAYERLFKATGKEPEKN